MDLEDRLRALEQACGGLACFHDLCGRIEPLVGSARIQHRHPSCRAAKRLAAAACTACDAAFCQNRLQQEPEGFLKRCHAGLVECYLPIREGALLAGALFLGPWRWTGTALPPEWALDPQVRHLRKDLAAPASQDPDRLLAALALGQLAASHLERLLERRNPQRPGPPDQEILDFARRSLTHSPSLADLAQHLGTGLRRASGEVRRRCGCSWPALLNRLRLERARRLLALTGLSVRDIAQRCGLADARYLHRLFRRSTGQTPLAFRQTGGDC